MIATVSEKSVPTTSVAKKGGRKLPLWMQWRSFWAVSASILAIVGVGVYNVSATDAFLRSHTRESVLYLARRHALDLVRQIRTSMSALQALEAIIEIDECGSTMEHFETLAELLIRTYKGISNLQLAPFGTVQHIHPLVTESQDNRAALGTALLLDPVWKDGAIRTILSSETFVIGPLRLIQGGIGAIARRPLFTSGAPMFLPDEWFFKDGVNYTRICSDPAVRENRSDVICSFPGPPRSDGHGPMYFWGFATMILTIEDLLYTTQLQSLEEGKHRVAGISKFAFEVSDLAPHASVLDINGVWQRSSNIDALKDAVQAEVKVAEFGIDWALKVAPMDGWPAVSDDFWRQLLLVLPMTALLGGFLGVAIILSLRRHALKLVEIAKYQELQKKGDIQDAVSNLNVLQFPMCLLQREDFVEAGELLRHEDAREAGKLRFFDDPTEVAETCWRDGTTFISHKWAAWNHPDPKGHQYRAVLFALEEFRSRNIPCALLWVDYTSIPQSNVFLQQAAINSLSVYATYSSVFLTLVTNDSNDQEALHSYNQRGWCRLELLSFMACGWSERESYICDGYSLTGRTAMSEEMYLDVLGGSFSCCARKHPDGMQCDRVKIRSAMLGIYWRLLSMQRDVGSAHQGFADELLQLIEMNPDTYFPSHLLVSETGKTSRTVPLFDGYLTQLQAMFKADSELEASKRLAVPGLCDPNVLIPCEAVPEPTLKLTLRSRS